MVDAPRSKPRGDALPACQAREEVRVAGGHARLRSESAENSPCRPRRTPWLRAVVRPRRALRLSDRGPAGLLRSSRPRFPRSAKRLAGRRNQKAPGGDRPSLPLAPLYHRAVLPGARPNAPRSTPSPRSPLAGFQRVEAAYVKGVWLPGRQPLARPPGRCVGGVRPARRGETERKSGEGSSGWGCWRELRPSPPPPPAVWCVRKSEQEMASHKERKKGGGAVSRGNAGAQPTNGSGATAGSALCRGGGGSEMSFLLCSIRAMLAQSYARFPASKPPWSRGTASSRSPPPQTQP